MEGYTNIAGSQYDFDDLDIEGREAGKIKDYQHLDERSLLDERVRVDNGQMANVFSVERRKDNTFYTCHICTETLAGLAALRRHAASPSHRANMNELDHPRHKFAKLDPKERVSIEPGEPVPPGLEEALITPCNIQPSLDAWKTPLIGLEFLVELTDYSSGVFDFYYYCLLCDKTGPERNIMVHITSSFHYMKYLSIYFPTVARKLHSLPNKNFKKSFGLLVAEIVSDIEAKYGRLKPCSEKHVDFAAQGRQTELCDSIYQGPHIREGPTDRFEEKATAENLDKKIQEVSAAPPQTTPQAVVQIEANQENSENTVTFNKNTRVNMDKKQLRSREDNNRSPDVQIVNVQFPKDSTGRKRNRSKSLSSVSSASSTSSLSKSKNRSAPRNHSRVPLVRARFRSRSRSPRHRRKSPHRRHSRSPRNRKSSYDRSPRISVDQFGRTRPEKKRSDKSRRDNSRSRDSPGEDEKLKWAKFREELAIAESVKMEKLRYHEKNPEQHPQYPDEWKSFWNRRYNELQRSGIDPSKHDFKPEWISFWTKRMKEMYEEELHKAKEELRHKFGLHEDYQKTSKHGSRKSPGLVDVSPPTPENRRDMIDNIKNTWKAFTGSDIKEGPKRSLSPWEEDSRRHLDSREPFKRDMRKLRSRSRSQSPGYDKLLEEMPQKRNKTSSLIFVLRKLTVLEEQLGTLAPRMFDLLSQALALEKIKLDASLDLLMEVENAVFLETIREKLIALLCAGVVPRQFVNTARSATKHIDIALYLATKTERSLHSSERRPGRAMALPSLTPQAQYEYSHSAPVTVKPDPVVVPGVGQVDKVAIAQQIAAALVAQGKDNVTEGELEQLIAAVVGMAEASANSNQPMTTAAFLNQLQSGQSTMNAAAPATVPAAPVPPTFVPPTSVPPTPIPPAPLPPTVSMGSIDQPPVHNPNTGINEMSTLELDLQPKTSFGALKLLQSAYNEPSKPDHDSPKVDVPEFVEQNYSSDFIRQNVKTADNELAAAHERFKSLNHDERASFIKSLQVTHPNLCAKLIPLIRQDMSGANDQVKRSPITIPISKEKSEQKIKSIPSGRLSPFSSRSGSSNPVIGERILEDESDKNDVGMTSKGSQNQQLPGLNLSEYEDDDDDDYSFEDVYKAAQERLRQKQMIEDKKIDQASVEKETQKSENIPVIDVDAIPNVNVPKPIISNNNTNWNQNITVDLVNDPPEINMERSVNPQPIEPTQASYPGQGAYPSQGGGHPGSFQQQPYPNPNQPAFGSGYPEKDPYSRQQDPMYSNPSQNMYASNRQYIPPQHPAMAGPEPYSMSQRGPYAGPDRGGYAGPPRRDPYEAPSNYQSPARAYGSQNPQYGDQYGGQPRYRDPQYDYPQQQHYNGVPGIPRYSNPY